MENNPGDSSSESDIADPWSIIDRDSCEPEDLLVDRVKDTCSVGPFWSAKTLSLLISKHIFIPY